MDTRAVSRIVAGASSNYKDERGAMLWLNMRFSVVLDLPDDAGKGRLLPDEGCALDRVIDSPGMGRRSRGRVESSREGYRRVRLGERYGSRFLLLLHSLISVGTAWKNISVSINIWRVEE